MSYSSRHGAAREREGRSDPPHAAVRALLEEDLAQIAQIADELDLPAGKVLIREGDRGREFFVVVSGEVEVAAQGTQGRDPRPGSFFGEMALLSHAPRSATVTALTPLDMLVITDRAFVAPARPAARIWLKVARALAERVHADESRDS